MVPKKLKGRLFNLTIRFLILMESMTDIQESQEGLPVTTHIIHFPPFDHISHSVIENRSKKSSYFEF